MSRIESPVYIWPDKHPDAKLQYGVDFERECARQWKPFTDYSSGVKIRVYPTTGAGGFEFSSSGGRTGGSQPRWPTVLAGTVNDGSITWTAGAISSSSLERTVSGTPSWTADSGVTVSSEAVSGTLSSAFIEGGTDDNDYVVAVTATLSDGQEATAAALLPVRIPSI